MASQNMETLLDSINWQPLEIPDEVSLVVVKPVLKHFTKQLRTNEALKVKKEKSPGALQENLAEPKPKNNIRMADSLTDSIFQCDTVKKLEANERNTIVCNNERRKRITCNTVKWSPRADQQVHMMPLDALFNNTSNGYQNDAPCLEPITNRIQSAPSTSTESTTGWLPNSYKIIPQLSSVCPDPATNTMPVSLSNELPLKLSSQDSKLKVKRKGNKKSNKLDKISGHTPEEINFDSLVPSVQNVTVSVNLECELDMDKVKLLPNCSYNPHNFSAVTMRLKNPKCTGLIFPNGRVVCTGANSIENSRIACRRFARILQNINYPVKFKNFTVQNLVGGYHFQFDINLLRLYETLKAKRIVCDYTPQVFPGLKYNTGIGNICAKVFGTGQVVIVGAKTLEEIKQAFEIVCPNIYEHRIDL